MGIKILGQHAVEAFEARGISSETAARLGIYTASSVDDGHGHREVLPDAHGNLLVFPFVEHEVVVNDKYRRLPWQIDDDKPRFWQRAGGKRTFWNVDVLDDPALEDGRLPLNIFEGEIDALTAIDCNFQHSVSVPDGAPPVPKGVEPDQLSDFDPAAEATGKFEFLWNNRDRLKKIKRFRICTDNDGPGKRLAAELVRRLQPVKCEFITYPEGCKDINEVVQMHGRDGVSSVLMGSKPYPVRGLYRLNEYPDLGRVQTFTTGWQLLDQHITLFLGELMVVTGIPGHGKSTWVLNLMRNVADLHGWRSVLYSPELGTVPHLRDKLRVIKLARQPWLLDVHETARLDAWINANVLFIDHDPMGDDQNEITLDWIIERATDAVMRDGIRLLVIDPWNEVEHNKRKDESMHEYIGRAIRKLRRWAQQYETIVIVVAHPTKDVGREGKYRAVQLYDIDGSSHWFNKPDHGITVAIEGDDEKSVIYVRKVRIDDSGSRGKVKFSFDKEGLQYMPLDWTRN